MMINTATASGDMPSKQPSSRRSHMIQQSIFRSGGGYNRHMHGGRRRTTTLTTTYCWFVIILIALSSTSPTTSTTTDPAVKPTLPFGDINVVILTDIHTWLGGHSRQESYNDVDLGHVLSFWERLKHHCDSHNMDLFLVNNGDFVHGTGLHRIHGSSDDNNKDDEGDEGTTIEDPSYVIPLLERMPYDAINCGNHELYSASNVQYMTRPGGYIDWWGDRYITSNIMRQYDSNGHKILNDPLPPLSAGRGVGKGRFLILEGSQRNTRLLTFGFLYNMGDDATDQVLVQTVEETVSQSWFHDALRLERYDAILVLAHMDLTDNLVTVIQESIRKLIGQGTPVVFVTGHTHYRGVKQLEDLTVTIEAGRYLDTIGFVSFPTKENVRRDNASALFNHKFIDTNQKVLFQDTLGMSSSTTEQAVMTSNGKQLSEFITLTRQQLGLDEVVGCAPHAFLLSQPLHTPVSLWGLYRDQVIPKIFMGRHRQAYLDNDDDNEMAMLVSSESWRYDLYANNSLSVDDIIAVAPFNDTVVYLGQFPSFSILKVNETLNKNHQDPQSVPDYVLIGDILYEEENSKKHKLYHLYTHEFDVKHLQYVLKDISGKSPKAERTSFQSTMIWLAFVTEYWPCDNNDKGGSGQLPDWFPTPNHIMKNTYGKNNNNRQKSIAVVMSFGLIGLIALGLYVGWIVFQSIYSRLYQPPLIVIQNEIELFNASGNNMGGYADDDDDNNDGFMKEKTSAVVQIHNDVGNIGNKSFADAEDTELAQSDLDADDNRPSTDLYV
jgi:2',3'-cyclic-nucleotide 2'-phosphodiesterase (5'-nucleotidase family)